MTRFQRAPGSKLKVNKKKHVRDECSKEETEEVEDKPADSETEEKNVNEEKRVKKIKRGNKRKLEEEASTEVNDQETNNLQNDAKSDKFKGGFKRYIAESSEIYELKKGYKCRQSGHIVFDCPELKDISDSSEKFIVINGTKIEVMYFGGSLVKKDDGLRLIKLRKDLNKIKLPQKTINMTIKFESELAEKALANQSGHSVLDCPEINKEKQENTSHAQVPSEKGTIKVENKPADSETEEKNVNEENGVKKMKRGNKRKLEEEASTEVNDQETNNLQNDAKSDKFKGGFKRYIAESSETYELKKGYKCRQSGHIVFDCPELKDISDSSEKFIVINDKKIKVMYFCKSLVKKYDGLRLIRLRKNLIKLRLPKTTIGKTIRFERKLAEKALPNPSVLNCPELKDISDSFEKFIVINDTKINVMYFGKYLVKKDDGLRLIQLRKDLNKIRLPKETINATMKFESELAEKALANQRRHSVLDCSEINKEKQENTSHAQVPSEKGTIKVENKPADSETEEKNVNEENGVKKMKRGNKRKLEEEASTEVSDQETKNKKVVKAPPIN